jgi:hypothetical protein
MREIIKNRVDESSILGPQFFFLYINDLPKIIIKNNSLFLFAENTNLLITGFNKSDIFLILVNHSAA